MSFSELRVRVELANPGQFFACCGLLELADRLLGGAEGWFGESAFWIRSTDGGLNELLPSIAKAELKQLDGGDDTASAIGVGAPFGIRLDWWQDEYAGGRDLKVWAGSMRGVRIARAMQGALARAEAQDEGLFDHAMVVYDVSEPDKKVEPFYFDARRGCCARPIDIGFSPDSLRMTSAAYPAVEFLCLVGLQRFRPTRVSGRRDGRFFEYFAWGWALTPSVAAVAASGRMFRKASLGFRFENVFRTDQRKHKAFGAATPI